MSKILLAAVSTAAVALICMLLGILPTSPFLAYISWSDMSDWLGFVNYVLPIGDMIVIAEAWIACISPWIFVQIAIKALKVVGSYI